MASISKGLGKGLSALVKEHGYSDNIKKTSFDIKLNDFSENNDNVSYVSIDKIEVNPLQPRKYFADVALQELSESIKTQGILQPIVLCKSIKNTDKFIIVAGERRYRAAKLAGLDKVPAITLGINEEQAAEISIIENIQREDLNPIEEADAYNNLIKTHNYTHEKLAARLHKSRAHITNMLRLIDLPEQVKHMIAQGKINMGHARAIATTADPIEFANDIIRYNWSVRETEKAVNHAKNPKIKNKSGDVKNYTPIVSTQASQEIPITTEKNPEIITLEQLLGEKISANVSINIVENQGNLTIYFSSLDELDRIISAIT